MKRNRIMFIAGAASLLAVAAFSSNPLPEDTMYAVRRMLRVAQKPFQDNLTWDYEVIEPEYYQPEVFFGIRLKGDWPVERRKAALDAYLAVMADTDFTDTTNRDRDLPFKATAQCVSMNYTNALPYMRRLVLNTTLVGWRRRNEIRKLIEFSPVNDETTATVETIFTQSVCDRAARVFTRDPTEWQLYRAYDIFWKKYYAGYAMSSNRLEFAQIALANTNITQDTDWAVFKRRFTSVTNQLLSSGQPLQWINMSGGGN